MSANDREVGGSHYMKPIQPWDFIAANGLDFFQGTIIEYLCRWREKGGVEDLRKAHHYLEKYIELQHTPEAVALADWACKKCGTDQDVATPNCRDGEPHWWAPKEADKGEATGEPVSMPEGDAHKDDSGDLACKVCGRVYTTLLSLPCLSGNSHEWADKYNLRCSVCGNDYVDCDNVRCLDCKLHTWVEKEPAVVDDTEEIHSSHDWTDTKGKFKRCIKCGCHQFSKESWRPCGRPR